MTSLAPYRDDPVRLDALRDEARELHAMVRDARLRRVRACVGVGSFTALAFVGIVVLNAISSRPAPRLRCHRVTIEEEPAGGLVAPPRSWVVCGG